MKSASILIIDKEGLIGEPLARKLSNEAPIVFVSQNEKDLSKHHNITHIPFLRKIPTIPDYKYSHVVVIEHEVLDLKILLKIIDNAKDSNSEFIFALSILSKGENKISKVLNAYSTSKIVLYGEILENNHFIYSAQKFNKIQIEGEGLSQAHVVSTQDVADKLTDIILGLYKSDSFFYIFPKHPPSELALAHMIQKANPQVLIDFIKATHKKENIFFLPNGKYLLDDKYELAKKIREIDIKKATNFSEKAISKKRSGSLRKFLFFIFWILIFLTFAPLIFTIIFSFLGLNTLYFAKTEMDKGSLSNIRSSLHLSETFFYMGKKTSDILLIQGRIVGLENKMKRLLTDIDLGHSISQNLLRVVNAGDYFAKTLNGESINPKDDFTKAKFNLKSAIIVLEKIRAEGKMPALFLEKIKSIDPIIKLASNTLDITPGIFGLEGQRTYLVLFQNNMKLRPGGGFIGSYGILKLNMGKITEFSIHDADDADSKLRGHAEPPFAIRRHLPSTHWYLRDSNFAVDFVKSATSSSNLLNAETGVNPDGVIGVDLFFVKNILQATGPVFVSDYKETVSEHNFFQLTEKHTEKEDFLRSLYKVILAKITSGNISYTLLPKALSDSLSQKHLMFVFNNEIQNIFTVNGWSSSLWDERKNDGKNINDFLGINEANLEVNSVNYFIKRQVSQKVTIENNGNVSEELTISYKNESTAEGDNYKNYLRIILPQDTALSEVSINDNVQIITDAVTDPLIYEAKNFKIPLGLEVEKTTEENKAIYGFLVNVPVGELVRVKIKYNLAKQIFLDLNSFSYNLKLFKQPGIDNIPYSFSLAFPDSFNIINGKSTYSEKIAEDKDLIINFTRK